MKICLLCPTRGRSLIMDNVWFSARDTASSFERLEIFYYIDLDDLSSIERAKQLRKEDERVNFFVSNRPARLAVAYNTLFELSNADVFFIVSDDVIVETKRWDLVIRNKLDKIHDKIALLHGFDAFTNGPKFGAHPILHRKWIETIGYVFPPQISRFSDTWINNVADIINRKFSIDVRVYHNHWTRKANSNRDSTSEHLDSTFELDVNFYKTNKFLIKEDAKKLLRSILI